MIYLYIYTDTFARECKFSAIFFWRVIWRGLEGENTGSSLSSTTEWMSDGSTDKQTDPIHESAFAHFQIQTVPGINSRKTNSDRYKLFGNLEPITVRIPTPRLVLTSK